MKGKAKEKRKIGKAILIAMGFFLTIVLTFTSTLAWFYDSDWASKTINMAGTVGIEMQDGNGIRTTGEGKLYFNVFGDDPNGKAYPGQAISASASVYNNGGKSGIGGSACYVRARFVVYTNIGQAPKAAEYDYNADYADDLTFEGNKAYNKAVNQFKLANPLISADDLPEALEAAGITIAKYKGGESSFAYIDDLQAAEQESDMNATELYKFLLSLIKTQNSLINSTDPNTKTNYYWQYYQHTGAMPLTANGTSGTPDYYLDGEKITSEHKDYANKETITDNGYFYLCHTPENAGGEEGVLKPLTPPETADSRASFLWNSTFIIPWQLTNLSADKTIFVGLSFQAIQTFIPKVNLDTDRNGIIDGSADNKVAAIDCTYNHNSVQTVFNSCNFTPISVPEEFKTFDNVSYLDDTQDLITPTTPQS